MSNFQEVNKQLLLLEREIQAKTYELNEARETYLIKKAAYENYFAKSLLETKVKNPSMTQSEINAMATNLAYNERLEFIKAESRYRSITNNLKAINSKIEIAKELSFNLRKEASL